MGLYLYIGNDGGQIDGADFGKYADFGAFRQYVASQVERGTLGHKFPVLLLHSDRDGEWTVDECHRLRAELLQIGETMHALPPAPVDGQWQLDLVESRGMVPANAIESFFDADGMPVLVRLLKLTAIAIEHGRPIVFQ